ncbi:GNAT family N-acetyltransferase [Peterkaempfera sp. SMS 1(5)a]|uniref:GNAT family N-acetyltransferase n=1 Tax=Peterkaempfera podocarpi TaxID=3232308 RepID=UPI00366F57E7
MSDPSSPPPPALVATPRIRIATRDDIGTAAAVLTDALIDDPVTRWVFPDDRDRPLALPEFFREVVSETLSRGEVHLTEEDDAVVLLTPPTTDLHRRTGHAPGAAGPGAHPAGRPAQIERLLHAHHPRERHYYVQFQAVLPGRQGQGLCSALLHRILARADAEGVGAYIECSTPRSLALLLRHGFRELPPIQLPDGPALHPAWRDPRRAAAHRRPAHAPRSTTGRHRREAPPWTH